MGRRPSLRHQIGHVLPLSMDEGADDYLPGPRRRWTTTERASPLGRLIKASLRRQQFGRTGSLRPPTPGTPGTPQDTPRAEQSRLLPLERMVSSPPNMASGARHPSGGKVSSPGQPARGGSLLQRLLSRRNAASQTTLAAPPVADDLEAGEVSPTEQDPLSPETPPPPPPRPALTRAVSLASSYSTQFREEEDLVEVDGPSRFTYEQRQTGKLSKILYITYMKACGWGFGILYLIMVLLAQGTHVGMDFWLSEWSEAATEWNRTHERQWEVYLNTSWARNAVLPSNVTQSYQAFVQREMAGYFRVYGLLAVSVVVLSLVSNLSGQWAGSRARRTLHRNLLATITRCRKAFFDVTPVGQILNRFSSDVTFIDKKLATSIHMLMFFVLQCLSAVIINAVVTWWFIIVALVIFVIYYGLQKFYRKSAIELQRLDSYARSPVLSHFSETQAGLLVIRASGHQERFFSEMLQCVDLSLSTSLIYESGKRWLGIALDYLGAVIVFLASVIAVSAALADKEAVPSALVGLAINYTLLIPMYLVWVVRFLAEVEMYMCAVERVDKYTRLRREDYRSKNIVSPSWPQEGKIEFVGASLGYGDDGEATTVIKDLNLTIAPKEKVALCGRSGSGKSTLAMSLFQMSDLLQGQVLVDGTDLTRVPLQAIRSRLALIPQEPLLFSGTVRSNLDPQTAVSDERIWAALEMAQMKETVRGMDGGLEAEVHQGGENFSVGQRQLLCLARALLRDARIVIMDEPTSSLDGDTERQLQDIVQRGFANSTVVTIAHQIFTVMDYDRVLVLARGKGVCEEGRPRTLARQTGGVFAEMVRAARDQAASINIGLTEDAAVKE